MIEGRARGLGLVDQTARPRGAPAWPGRPRFGRIDSEPLRRRDTSSMSSISRTMFWIWRWSRSIMAGS
jgi:hypothetical protein